jgi:hypothetical protein
LRVELGTPTPPGEICGGAVETTDERFECNMNKVIVANAGQGSQPLKTPLTYDGVEPNEHMLDSTTKEFRFRHGW